MLDLPCTVHPDSAWVSQQAKNFLMVADDLQLPVKQVMRDNDVKYSAQFDEALKSSGAEVMRNIPLSPNLRAHVERFIQTLKVECLDKFVIVAERHLNHVCREWRLHYNRERPHSARQHLPPDFDPPQIPLASMHPRDVVCHTRLGGLLKSYARHLNIAVHPLPDDDHESIVTDTASLSRWHRHFQPPQNYARQLTSTRHTIQSSSPELDHDNLALSSAE